MDVFVVPTISFRLLYGLLILRLDPRRILWLGATAVPTKNLIERNWAARLTFVASFQAASGPWQSAAMST
jgi:hypothetical protein